MLAEYWGRSGMKVLIVMVVTIIILMLFSLTITVFANTQVTSARFIAFERNGDIHLYDRQSGSIVDSIQNAINPSITPDGRYIAFSRPNGDNNDIFLYDRQNQSLTNITSTIDEHETGPSISSNGHYLSCSLWYPHRIRVYDLTTMDVIVGFGNSTLPVLSALDAEGRYIAYHWVNAPGPTNDIFLKTLPNLELILIINKPGQQVEPSIDGNANLIAYVNIGNPNWIWLYNRTDNSDQPLFAGSHPSLSNDGRFIAFERDGDIYLYDLALKVYVDLPGLNTTDIESWPATR